MRLKDGRGFEAKSGGYIYIGFAIPINMVKAIKEQIIAHGKVERGYLGAAIQELTKTVQPHLQGYGPAC